MRMNPISHNRGWFEKLEDRQLLTVTPSWNESSGTLELKSDSAADNIVVYSEEVGNGAVVAMAKEDGIVVFDGAKSGASITEVKQLQVYGGSGNDTIDFSKLNAEWELGKKDNPAVWAWGEGGNDSIVGSPIHNATAVWQVDALNGGDNNDTLSGGGGRDFIDGQSGDDYILGGIRDDWLLGGEGNDNITGGDGEDQIQGGIGIDYIAGDNASSIVGASYNDFIYGDDTTPSENDAADLIDGESGDDTIVGGGGDDLLYGGGSTDSFGGGDDSIWGGGGMDDIYGDEGFYTSSVSSGNDTLMGDAGSDLIYGGNLTDKIDGGSECDSLYGEGGKDSIWGGAGDDYAEGGSGEPAGYNFVMQGGSGKDTFLPDYPTDTDASEPCGEGLMGPEVLEGDPVLLKSETVAFRDQRFTFPFLATLQDGDLYRYLGYYGMSDEQINMVRRWRNLLLAGDFSALAAQSNADVDCGCGDWSM